MFFKRVDRCAVASIVAAVLPVHVSHMMIVTKGSRDKNIEIGCQDYHVSRWIKNAIDDSLDRCFRSLS